MAKPLSGSTAPSLGTRSRTCTWEASTLNPRPRYFLIVRALAGDSTITRLSAMVLLREGARNEKPRASRGYEIRPYGRRLSADRAVDNRLPDLPCGHRRVPGPAGSIAP